MAKRMGAFTDAGLLVLRLGIGAAFVMQGWPKISGGLPEWKRLGAAMAPVGITFAPAFWGFIAAFGEFVGGIALALGVLTRPFCVLMGAVMFVGAAAHLRGAGAFAARFERAREPAEMLVVFLALFLAGPGRYAFARLFKGRAKKG